MLGQHGSCAAAVLCGHSHQVVSRVWKLAAPHRSIPAPLWVPAAAARVGGGGSSSSSSRKSFGTRPGGSGGRGVKFRDDRGAPRAGRPLPPREQQQQRRSPGQQRQPPSQQWGSQQDYDEDDDWQGEGDSSYDSGFQYPARPSKASIRATLTGDGLYGVAPVLAALTAGVRQPYALLMQEGLSTAGRKDGKALSDIKRLAAAAGAEIRTLSKHDLNMLSGNRPHQGVMLDASLLPWRDLDMLPDPSEAAPQQQDGSSLDREATSSSTSSMQHPVWLALDEVVDPQNLGAMLRSAYCLGASGVLVCARNCSPLSPTVSKASAGAMELMTLHSCKSMPRTLAAAVNAGWAVTAAAAEAGAVPLAQFRVDRPTVLVMGNEGYGVRPVVKRLCSQLVQIEMAQQQQHQHLVDSLNVSVAAGIFLHHMLTSARV